MSEVRAEGAPDEVLLRRFGQVRAVGGAAYAAATALCFAVYGSRVWPLLTGVAVLTVVTTAYFVFRQVEPRRAVALSLVADAIVLAGAIALLGGAGAGLIGLYAIVVVSAGIMLGTGAAASFTALVVVLAVAQLFFEGMVVEPSVLYRPDLEIRVPVLLLSLAGVASVGYLTSTYAGRLHELVSEAGAHAADVRAAGRRRTAIVERASRAVARPLEEVEEVVGRLAQADVALPLVEQRRLADRLRVALLRLDGEVAQLADAGLMEASEPARPTALRLDRVVADAVTALDNRLAEHEVVDETDPLTVLAAPREARRVVWNLLENVIEHTPVGTTVRLATRRAGSHGVLAVTDDGPGVPPQSVPTLFDPDGSHGPRIGLPLVRELCAEMGAEIGYEPPRAGGARFLVSFRLAPGVAARDADVAAEAAAEASASAG